MTEVSLTKYDFLSKIDLTTPSVAIYDIATCLGLKADLNRLSGIIYRSQVAYEITKKTPIRINTDKITVQALELIAFFLNPKKIRWKVGELNDAFRHTLSLLGGDITPDNLEVGYPEPNSIYLISPAIAAGILTRKNISLYPDMQQKDLEMCLKRCNDKPQDIFSSLINRIYCLTNEDMIFLLSRFNNLKPVEKPDPFWVSQYITNGSANKEIFPRNSSMAIAIAAVKYKIDISSAENYIEELQALVEGNFPVSHRMKKIFQVNKAAFNLDFSFNEIFPIEAYDLDKLCHLGRKNGIQFSSLSPDYNKIYNSLIVKFRVNGFYRSVLPSVTELKTQTNMKDITKTKKHRTLLSYGCNGNFKLFLADEISEMFETYQSFRFGEDEEISLCSVEDLRRIAEFSKYQKSTIVSDKKSWIRLEKIIEEIKTSLNHVQLQKESFRNFYLNNNEKEKIKTTLFSIYDLSLYMRGWDGVGKKPIYESDIPRFTDTEYETKKKEADRRSYLKLKEILKEIESFELVRKIVSFPLVRMYNGTFEFSNSSLEGATIYDRLKIVDEDIILNGCIGMSSNWLLSSSYFYLDSIGCAPKISISNMAITSESTRRISSILSF